MPRTFKLFFLILIFSTSSFSFASDLFNSDLFGEKYKAVVKLEYKYFEMSRIYFYDIDVAGVDIRNNLVDIYATEYQIEKLQEEGMNINIDWSNNLIAAPDKEYKNPTEIEDILRALSIQYSDIAELKSIGKSLEGRDIWALKISDHVQIHEKSEPSLLINSMHHAREIMGPEVALDMATYLLKNYTLDAKVSSWVNNNEIWIVPMLNVDGNAKVWRGKNMWRKNTRDGHGVDLNRNYPFAWNSCNGSSGWKNSQTYRGPTPASEPETKVLMNLVSKIRPIFDISYHSYSEIVIYPLGCKNKRTVNTEVVEGIGKELGLALDYEAGTAWELLYSVDGGDIDWMYGVYGVIPYVIEVNSRSQGFQPSFSKWRNKTVKRNRPAWMHLLNRLEGPGIRGIINNSRGDFKVKVTKFENGINLNVGTYLGKSDGSFHIVLTPGTYTLTIDKLGISKTVNVLNKRINLIL